jgi:hypothetical protein
MSSYFFMLYTIARSTNVITIKLWHFKQNFKQEEW